MGKFWLTLFLPNGFLIFWIIFGKLYVGVWVDTGVFCETNEVEGSTLREEYKSECMFYCMTGKVHREGVREPYKS